MAKIAVVFPGQGSQVVGMGQAFHDSSPQAAELFDIAEKASGLPIRQLCFEGPMDELTRTINLQPSITTVDLACWQALDAAGVKPFAVAGHSLGEYPALAACGTISAADCISLVALRAKLMDRDAGKNPGAMSAIIGPGPEDVADLCESIEGVIQPANYNAPTQTVITGSKEAVGEANKKAKADGFKAIPLKVSGAWHSPFMADAGKGMAEALAKVSFSAPTCLHVPNTTGAPTDDADVIGNEIQKQLTSSVRWVQTVEALIAQGVDTFIECGPKNVLSGLIKKTSGDVRLFNFADPEGLEKVLAEL